MRQNEYSSTGGRGSQAAALEAQRILQLLSGVELKADAGRNDHVELGPPPRLLLERADPGGEAPVLRVEGVQVGDPDAEAGIVGPLAVIVLDEVERDGVAGDPGSGGGLLVAAVGSEGEDLMWRARFVWRYRCIQATLAVAMA